MTMKLFSMAICAVLIAACGGGASPGDETSTTAGADTTTSEGQVTTTEPDYDAELVPIVEQARADLAARIDVEESSIETVSAEPVTWSDGSIGCPEEGKMYTQALVQGSRVVLEAEGETHDYHAGADDEPFLCPEERAEEPVQG